MVGGKTFNDTYTQQGFVNASNLTHYYTPGSENWHVSTHATAHLYGEGAQGTECGLYNTIAEVLDSRHDYAYFCSNATIASVTEFAYRFKEYSPDDLQKTYPRFTNRTITASAGECLLYDVINQTAGPANWDGRGSSTKFFYGNDPTDHITIPASYLGQGYTIYIYRGSRVPSQALDQLCGAPRCMWVWAYKDKYNNKSSKVFKCPITIGNVGNTSDDSQLVSNDLARIAAVSIALEGRCTTRSGENMARFAIASLANMAAFNPQIQVSGEVPHLGSHLEIRWGFVIGLIGGIIFAHLALFLLAIVAVGKVVVKDDSPLAVAHLLLPLLDVLAGEGTLLESKELAQVIRVKTGGKGFVAGPKVVEGEGQIKYSMGIGSNVKERREWLDHRHPAGTYL
ncbi:MAG: hypothetical protein Q9223_002748 [Gallowayella weberi]